MFLKIMKSLEVFHKEEYNSKHYIVTLDITKITTDLVKKIGCCNYFVNF